MDVVNRTVRMYRCAYRYQRWIWWWWWTLFAALAGLCFVLWQQRSTMAHRPWWTGLLLGTLVLAIARLAYYVPRLLFSGLFFTWFRYVALWASRAAGATRRWLLTGWRPDFYLLAVVAVVTWIFDRQPGKPAVAAGQVTGSIPSAYDPLQFLTWTFLVKVIVALLVVRIVYWGFKTRTRFVILPFTGYVARDELETDVQGLATLLSNELAGLVELSKRFDELAPDISGRGDSTELAKGEKPQKPASEGIAGADLQAPDVGSIFQGIVSGESKVKLGPVEIPIGVLFGTFGRIIQGPTITGSLHRDGGGMTLIASLMGGGDHKIWCVRSTELDEKPENDDFALRAMIEQMAYRRATCGR